MTDEPPFRAWEIPAPVLESWGLMPEHTALAIPMTRAMVDHLFFAVFGSMNAAAHTQSAVRHVIGGDADAAIEALETAEHANQLGLDRLRKFIASIMVTAEVQQ